MTERKEHELRAESLVSVWNAPDEAAATAVCDFLREQGIEAAAVAVQIAWLGGVETLHHGYWGKVEVLGRDAARARALVEDFLRAVPAPEEPPGEAPA
ncbi:MAG TPA: hypothetical protein VID50_01425 [Candidatus Eisenbacteria bacterium]|jgi:hypothetical protein